MNRRDLLILFGGSAIASRFAAGAQQQAMPVIGLLHFGSPGPFAPQIRDLRQGLTEIGYVEGQDVAIEYRWAEYHYDRLPALAAGLADRRVDLIVAISDASARAAKSATSTIPIVFMTGADPVADGLVASLAHPGNNLTGVSFLFDELHAKRLQLLCELLPQAKVIGLLVNPHLDATAQIIRYVREAARAKAVHLHIVNAGTETEIDAAFVTLVQQPVDGLLVASDPFFDSRCERIVTLASRYALPTIYAWRLYAVPGGLISYGPNLSAITRRLAVYAGRILKGARPADLPVEQPTRFELVINLKTAKALGLIVPQTLLASADEVIE